MTPKISLCGSNWLKSVIVTLAGRPQSDPKNDSKVGAPSLGSLEGICSNLFRFLCFLPVCSDMRFLFSDIPRSVQICSVLFRVVVGTPFLPTPSASTRFHHHKTTTKKNPAAINSGIWALGSVFCRDLFWMKQGEIAATLVRELSR